MITLAGCNALDYVLDRPALIYCAAMNPRQNALRELKIAGIKHLDFAMFFKMFGEGNLADAEVRYRRLLRAQLSDPAKAFRDRKIHCFSKGKSFYYRGTTGFFARFANLYIDLRNARGAIEQLFELRTLEQREQHYYSYI